MIEDWLAERFQANLPQMRQVAFRMLGSQAKADDAVVLATKFTNQTDPGDPNSAGNHRKKIVTSIEASCVDCRPTTSTCIGCT